MSFKVKNYLPVGGQVDVPGFNHPCGLISRSKSNLDDSPAQYTYKTEDTQATVETPGYFNDVGPDAKAGNLARSAHVSSILPGLKVSDTITVMYVTGQDTASEAITLTITYVITSTASLTTSIADAASYNPLITSNTDRIDFLESVVGAPNPIEPGDPDVLQFSIADNTLVGSVSQWANTTMTHFQYTFNTTNPPLGTGTAWTINQTSIDLSDYVGTYI